MPKVISEPIQASASNPGLSVPSPTGRALLDALDHIRRGIIQDSNDMTGGVFGQLLLATSPEKRIDLNRQFDEARRRVRLASLKLAFLEILGKGSLKFPREFRYRLMAWFNCSAGLPPKTREWLLSELDRMCQCEHQTYQDLLVRVIRQSKERKHDRNSSLDRLVLRLWLDPRHPLWMMDDKRAASVVEWFYQKQYGETRHISTESYTKCRQRLGLPKLGSRPIVVEFYKGEPPRVRLRAT